MSGFSRLFLASRSPRTSLRTRPCARASAARAPVGSRALRCAAAAACFACAALVSGCDGPPIVQGPRNEFQNPPPGPGSNTTRVAEWMTGSYTSAEQAAADPAYFNVTLHIARIWRDRSDGPWLYVEQGMADTPAQPYRQRVYRLLDHGRGVVETITFELPGDPLAYAGAWSQPARLNALDPALLQPRMGCTVTLHPTGPGEFVGATSGKDCLIDLRGAAYATSDITLTPAAIELWDRGYDTAGQQVWGARTGPYRLLKTSEAAR